jgi:alpha-beta hydrolase superfamily lysophospholipase
MPEGTAEAPCTVDAAGFAATLAGDPSAARAALFLSGSGPTDRDGNSRLGIRAGTLGKLAAALAGVGIASLRYDKRGLPGSPAALETSLTFDSLVDDAARILDWLEDRRGERPAALVGHSEGGLVALALARRRAVARMVLLATPGRPLAALIEEQLAVLPADLRQRSRAILASLAAGGAEPDVPAALAPLFRPSVQPYLRSLMALDPAALLRESTAPVLLVGGGHDLQVGRADFDALTAGRPDAERLWITGMNHVLVASPAERAANLASYGDPGAVLAPGLVAAVARFLAS